MPPAAPPGPRAPTPPFIDPEEGEADEIEADEIEAEEDGDDGPETAPERPARWDDLAVRFGVAGVLAVIGIVAMALGGWWFRVTLAAICGVMIWELVRMLAQGTRINPMNRPPRRRAPKPPADASALILGGLTAAALLIGFAIPTGYALPLVFAPGLVALSILPRHRGVFAPFSVLILMAGWGLGQLRTEFGFSWMLWLAAVVIVTDVFGYFAGRAFGGPRFWPRMSPKKTWSGTVAGWVAAAVVGLGWALWADVGFELVAISVALSMASQMGDISESAVKRKMGVKDSSNLLPGHGGLFDRFDGMLGAAILLLLFEAVVDFPPVPVPLAV